MIYSHIVVLLDGSELAECVLPHLETFLNSPQTKVDLVRAVPPLEMHFKAALPLDKREEQEINDFALKEAQDYLEKVKSRMPFRGAIVTSQILRGNPANVIADYLKSSGADLLLMATHGHSGVSRWIWGSTAEKLLRSTSLPIFLVRPADCRMDQEGH
jgi:nucleotide-binding universal stress UspA family protein